MEHTYAIALCFETDQGSAMTITVPGADPAATDAAVAKAMRRIIASGAVASAAGRPAAVRSAALVSTETLAYDLS